MTLRAATVARTGRYAIVGAICATTYNLVMILGDWAGVHYVVTSPVSFAIVTPLGYFLHVVYTFREQMSWRGFLRFASGLTVGFLISFVTVSILCSLAGLSAAIAAPIATVVLFFWNYITTHWAIRGYERLGPSHSNRS